MEDGAFDSGSDTNNSKLLDEAAAAFAAATASASIRLDSCSIAPPNALTT